MERKRLYLGRLVRGSGPLGDGAVDREDILPLFRNPFMEDVSPQYFQATDVVLAVTEHIPENTRYCYLCVFEAKEWHPVQWGRIERGNRVTFKGDGKDMTFDHIPEGTIYRVRVKGTNDRIFTYKNGIIRWY